MFREVCMCVCACILRRKIKGEWGTSDLGCKFRQDEHSSPWWECNIWRTSHMIIWRKNIPDRGIIKNKHPERRACLTYKKARGSLWSEQISEWESGTKRVQNDTHPVNVKPFRPVLGLWLLLGKMGSEDFEAEEWYNLI